MHSNSAIVVVSLLFFSPVLITYFSSSIPRWITRQLGIWYVVGRRSQIISPDVFCDLGQRSVISFYCVKPVLRLIDGFYSEKRAGIQVLSTLSRLEGLSFFQSTKRHSIISTQVSVVNHGHTIPNPLIHHDLNLQTKMARSLLQNLAICCAHYAAMLTMPSSLT